MNSSEWWLDPSITVTYTELRIQYDIKTDVKNMERMNTNS